MSPVKAIWKVDAIPFVPYLSSALRTAMCEERAFAFGFCCFLEGRVRLAKGRGERYDLTHLVLHIHRIVYQYVKCEVCGHSIATNYECNLLDLFLYDISPNFLKN